MFFIKILNNCFLTSVRFFIGVARFKMIQNVCTNIINWLASLSDMIFMTNCLEQLLNQLHFLFNVSYQVKFISCGVLDVE